MKQGIVITGGVHDWQIFQQENGFADIVIEGETVKPQVTNEVVEYAPQARVVLEDTSEIIFYWTDCERLPEDKWQITFKNVPVGGLYRIETHMRVREIINGIEYTNIYRGDIVNHVGVGDIYLITGQSNASGVGRGYVNDPPEIGVHQYRNSGNWDIATHPLNDTTDAIHTGHYELNCSFHSPFLNFAKVLKSHLGYPIGLVQAAKGGSFMFQWDIREDGYLYYNMLEMAKAAGGKFRGVLWYQGCSDAFPEAADKYSERFDFFVNQLRSDLNDSELPIITVQLNKHLWTKNSQWDECWGIIRESQRNAPKRNKNVYVIPTLDLPMSDCIHNSTASNMVVGDRLARMALGKIYGKKIACMAPDVASIKIYDKLVKIVFDNVISQIEAFVDVPDSLAITIEDEDGPMKMTRHFVGEENALFIELENLPKGDCLVSCGSPMIPDGAVPVDSDFNYPVLAFYRVKAIPSKS